MGSEMYIVKKELLGDAKERVLKLDRVAKKLLVYKRVKNEELNDHYSIRKDFDSSTYLMYEIEKAFDCIFGGEKSPTPEGVFNVLSKTTDEYVSGYYPEHDKVKFFGYLVIFEDYFIHSNLYEIDISEEAMRNDSSVQPISKSDNHTSGCVRVAQENLDWLVENVEVGTMAVL